MRRHDDGTLDEAEIERLAHVRALARGYREAARRALRFARHYRIEEAAVGGTREQACIAQAQAWRRLVRDLHAGRRGVSFPEGFGPGLVHARPGQTDTEGRKAG